MLYILLDYFNNSANPDIFIDGVTLSISRALLSIPLHVLCGAFIGIQNLL
jgi:hypothetical protein